MSTARAGATGYAPNVTITPPTDPKPIREYKSDPPTVTIRDGDEVSREQVQAIMNAAHLFLCSWKLLVSSRKARP